jgi:hypothetical protein
VGQTDMTFEKLSQRRSLRLTLTESGREALAFYFRPGVTWEVARIQDRFDPRYEAELFDPNIYDPLRVFGELIEYQVANGWSWLSPDDFALTSNPYLLSDDAAVEDEGTLSVSFVYFYNDYALRDPLAELCQRGEVIFAGTEIEPAS